MADLLRWTEVPAGCPLGDLLAPYKGIDADDTALDEHLLGDGRIQLFNPCLGEHFIGPGGISWYGFGHCALLAWHLHRKSGWQLVTLAPGVTTPLVHTAVQSPDGRIVDWRGAQDPDDAVNGYQRWLYPAPDTDPDRQTWRWVPNDPDEWVEQWLRGQAAWNIPAESLIEMGGWEITAVVAGHRQPLSPYDQFEITLTDFLASQLLADAYASLPAPTTTLGVGEAATRR